MQGDPKLFRWRSVLRRAGTAVVVVGLVSFVAGCSGGDDKPSAKSPSSDSSSSASSSRSSGDDKSSAAPSRGTDPVLKNYEPIKRAGKVPSPSLSASAAPFDKPVRYRDGVSLAVTGISQSKVSDRGAGEFTGEPKTTIDLQITNKGTERLALNGVVVTMAYGKQPRIARPVYDDKSQDFSGFVGPGKKARAVYAFSVPKSDLDDVTMYVDFDGKHAAARFTGSTAD
jgi:hypothetical protein